MWAVCRSPLGFVEAPESLSSEYQSIRQTLYCPCADDCSSVTGASAHLRSLAPDLNLIAPIVSDLGQTV
jgi:hypothetical protein